MTRRPRLTLVPGTSKSPDNAIVAGIEEERPRVRSGGLFSEAEMPCVEEDAILDADIFFTLPDVISLLQEQVAIGNLDIISKKTGIPPSDIRALLQNITKDDMSRLKSIRMILGVSRARCQPQR